ncbi:alpha/beta-hydrolase [Stereum hirsutum FP-91666 SS1]|uniref:alpha/beta-hydrolase n=1 Tax=Stereum hirsutum (strain FP-91666) TaxID=721885 RepID=UPI000440FC78|nr:alpha/beta-hydrolase [Stereum hirsutum FP-91666 SS1]EIM91451.1 alpha/beta-hydrolase [Stereum hirsutum FP-91666 SS1]
MRLLSVISSLLSINSSIHDVLASGPRVNLTIGVFEGLEANGGIERFLGIPFAQPPVGSLRFKAPVPINQTFTGVQNATMFGNACVQPPSSSLGAPTGEDCLFLNVWRPENVSTDSALPVLVWVYGGAFNTGAASDPEYNATILVQRSMEIGKPIIFVSANYRVNTFGFLASADMAVEDLNNGLQDQSAALRFVQENIVTFGGDSSKVTIWGQSAGAGSVEAQIVYNASAGLFRGAIMDSMTGPFKSSPPPSTYDAPGKPFALILNATGCSAGPTAFACLQDAPTEVWQPTVAPGSFSPARASETIASGEFLHIPMIAGTNLNEGNSFSASLLGLNLTGYTQDLAFDNFVRASVIDQTLITSDVLDQFHKFYPANDPSEGAPFNTGDSLFDRAAAWYGDFMFLSARRRFLDVAASLQPTFVYHFREFIPGNNVTLGVSHASELPLIFGPVPAVAAVEDDFAITWRDFYINFVNDLNPGSAWPQFTNETRQVLQLKRDNITTIPDGACAQSIWSSQA